MSPPCAAHTRCGADCVYRQGTASVFQITMHKNLNAFHRVEGVKTHFGVYATKEGGFTCVVPRPAPRFAPLTGVRRPVV